MHGTVYFFFFLNLQYFTSKKRKICFYININTISQDLQMAQISNFTRKEQLMGRRWKCITLTMFPLDWDSLHHLGVLLT